MSRGINSASHGAMSRFQSPPPHSCITSAKSQKGLKIVTRYLWSYIRMFRRYRATTPSLPVTPLQKIMQISVQKWIMTYSHLRRRRDSTEQLSRVESFRRRKCELAIRRYNILPVSAYSCILMRWSMEVFATGYHLSAMKLKQVRVCSTCRNKPPSCVVQS